MFDPEDIPKLDRRGLRQFGLTAGGIVIGLFGLVVPLLRHHPSPAWPWALGAGLIAWALLSPRSLDPLYQGWMRVGLLLGWINTRLVLAIVFYGVVLPTGMLRRWVGGDPLQRRFDPRAETYRTPSANRPASTMEKPF